jgi:hypothetical protein
MRSILYATHLNRDRVEPNYTSFGRNSYR